MKKIQDEFSTLPIGNSRKWVLRQIKLGLCVVCGGKSDTKRFCAKHAATHSANHQKHKKKHPLKYKARAAANNALAAGKITRGKCHCGEVGEAHHEDYAKPLEIKWLCIKHHKEYHATAR